MKMKVSVVIPAKNAEETIGYLLHSLMYQTVKPHEIIVIDDGSTDNTGDIARRFRNVKVIVNRESKGANFSRNLGILESTGDIIAFTDSDCEVDAKWIENISKLFKECDVSAISGAVYSGNIDKFLSRFLEQSIISPAPKYNKDVILKGDLNPFVIVTTANFAIRKSIIEKVGLFDPEYRHYGSDDMDYAYRILRSGFKILCTSKVKVKHYHRVRLSKVIKRYFQYGQGFAIFKIKNPQSIFSRLVSYSFLGLIILLISPVIYYLMGSLLKVPVPKVLVYLPLLPLLVVSAYHLLGLIKVKNVERILYIPLDLLIIASSLLGFLYMYIKLKLGKNIS